MANKSKKSQLGLTGLVLMVIGLAAAVMSFVSLAFDFIVHQSTIADRTTTTGISFSDWFEAVDTLSELEQCAGWTVGRVFLIISLVLVGILAVALLVKLFLNHKFLNLGVIVVSGLTIISALVFAIAMFVGCGAFTDITPGTYLASWGVYLIALFSIVTAAMSIVVCRKTK